MLAGANAGQGGQGASDVIRVVLLSIGVMALAGSAWATVKKVIPLPPHRPAVAAAGLPAAKQLFGHKLEPAGGAPRAIGGYADGCLAGAVPLSVTGPAWQVMRLSRNRNWGHPVLVRFLQRYADKVRA